MLLKYLYVVGYTYDQTNTTESSVSISTTGNGEIEEEEDTVSYIVGSVFGVIVLSVLIWYIAMKVRESKKTNGLTTKVHK